MADNRVQAGNPCPLGATWNGTGTNFALFSANATKVELCLFDAKGRRERARIALPEYTDQVWHGYLEDVQPGQIYGYRAHGPYAPDHGHRFNPHKLLLDPYARLLCGEMKWHDALFGYKVGSGREDHSLDRRDSAPYMQKCVVTSPVYASFNDVKPNRAWSESIIYEAHVKGFTKLHPKVPEKQRGTLAALAQPAIIDHLVKLGVTAIELLPIHAFVDDRFLIDKGLRNYWGYNTIGFFAPESRYLAVQELREIHGTIHKLHTAGIEVIMDVVYNHTAEGNQMGPTLSFRGIDNASYYRLSPENARFYHDTTGCGNSLNLTHPRVMQMVMDSLRYWAGEMGVDGFRFDLAPALARDGSGFNPNSAFLQAIRQDPVLSQVKMIAEPWDIGDSGFQVGGFPPGWSEWNGRYRDDLRDYWKGDDGKLPELASRLAGSADIYNHSGRKPWASINFLTAHDGFTLRDLVSYNEPHNEANQEQSGSDDNRSWNSGEEGETENEEVTGLRRRQLRNFLATLIFSQGVPMVLGGDEMGRTQDGNNNAYCQDNKIGWVNWDLADWQKELLAFTRRIIRLRREHPALRRAHFFTGRIWEGEKIPRANWFAPGGENMNEENWNAGFARTLGMHFTDETATDGPFMLLVNSHHEAVPFTLPDETHGISWKCLVDTTADDCERRGLKAGEVYPLEGRSLVLLIKEAAV